MSFLDHRYLHEAIRKGGKIKARVSKALVQGPARVGKTSVKCLLLSQRYNKEDSTGIAERPKVAVGDFSLEAYGKNEEKRWILLSDQNIVEMFANDIKTLIIDKEHDTSEKVGNNDGYNSTQHEMAVHPSNSSLTNEHGLKAQYHENESSTRVAHDKSYLQDSLPAPTTPITMSLAPENSPIPKTNLQLAEKKSKKRRIEVAEQLSDLLNKASGRTDNLTLYKDWLYFIDSGGQIQFQQILQAFIPCVSVLMLVINLAQDLSSQSSAELQCKDGKKYLVSEYSLQVETLIKRLVSMVAFSNYKQQNNSTSGLSSVIKSPDKLRVIAVATHGDECKKPITKAIEDKEAQLKQIFQCFSKNLLYKNAGLKTILFQVDGRKASDPKETFDDELKNTISSIHNELSQQAFEIDVPLRWYAYEILLRDSTSKSCGVLTQEECLPLGTALDLADDEIEPALRFFSFLNSILYYPKEVTNLVFIDPHSLIEVVNELMVLVCKVRNKVDVGSGTEAVSEMAFFGIISSDVFTHKKHFKKFHEISEAVTNLESEEDIDFRSHLFRIFTHLLLATKLPDSKPPNDRYFMPALLPLTDPSNAIPFESSHSTPLLIYFTNGAPVGLFCAMIVNLLSTKTKLNKFVWSLDTTNSTSEIYSNCVVLRNSEFLLGRVGFVESSDWFEIHCECSSDQLEVKKAVEYAIEKTMEKREIEVEWQIAFYCPCGKQPHHRAFLKENCSELFCELVESPYGVCIQVEKDCSPFSWISLKNNPGM